MKQVIRKLRILANLIGIALNEWRDEIWRRDLDETYCCDGRECGCYGSTRGEVYEWQRNATPASGGPRDG